jgi:predicted Zn-dependent protease
VDKAYTGFYDYGGAESLRQGRLALERVMLQLTGEYPETPGYWITASAIQKVRGDPDTALATLQRAVQKVPASWQLQLTFGVTQYELAAGGRKNLKAPALASLQAARGLTTDANAHKQIDQYIEAARKLPD